MESQAAAEKWARDARRATHGHHSRRSPALAERARIDPRRSLSHRRRQTTTANEALALLDETKADLFVSDLRLSERASGAACVREALRRHPDVKAVVVSGYDDPSSVEEALSSGAAVFVSKAADPGDVVSAIRQVFHSSIFVATGPRPSRLPGRQSGLTRREAEILELVSKGYSNAQLARMLWVTEQTVKFHLSNIYRKLGVANRTQAAHFALLHPSSKRSA